MRVMCGVQLMARKRVTILMLMMGLNKAMNKLAVASSVWCNGMCCGGRLIMSCGWH